MAAEHVKSVEPKRCGQQLQRSVWVGVCVFVCVRKEKRNFPAHTESLRHESKFSVAYFLGAIYIFQNKINEGRTREHSMGGKSPKDKSFCEGAVHWDFRQDFDG